MPSGLWASSHRRQEYPSNWHQIKAQVKRRSGGQCELVIDGKRCTTVGQDVDHIDRKGPHELWNLQLLCDPHHKQKTQREAQEARPSRKRTPEPHPGLRRQ